MQTNIYQSCWVVTDLEQAARHWAALGVGPFLYVDIDFAEHTYRGVSQSTPLKIGVGLAQAGAMQIEIIRQYNDVPSAYTDIYPLGTGGFHHVARMVKDYDAAVEAITRLGHVVATEARYGGVPFSYIDTYEALGAMTEIVVDGPIIHEINAKVKSAAESWDEKTVLRPLA